MRSIFTAITTTTTIIILLLLQSSAIQSVMGADGPVPTCVPAPAEPQKCKSDADCFNFGQCQPSTGECKCSIGFAGRQCEKIQCGSLAEENRPVKPDADKRCQCDDGWSGVNCNVCQRDNVCQKVVDPYGISDVKAICFKQAIMVKQYFHMCSVQNERLLPFLEGRPAEATFRCNKADAQCQFQVWIDSRESFTCRLSGCQFFSRQIGDLKRVGGQCDRTECKCIPGATLCGEPNSVDFSELMPTALGHASFYCQDPPYSGGRYNCEFDQEQFRESIGAILGDNPVFELKCDSGECMADYDMPNFEQALLSQEAILILTLSAIAVLCLLLIIYCCYNPQSSQPRVVGPSAGQTAGADVRDQLLADEWDQLMERGRHAPVSLSFKNISYEIMHKGRHRRVLRGIYGHVRPGEVMAIMGPSGSGKSTCLDILASKPKSGIVYGKVFVNGHIPSRQLQKQISGFVDQEDQLLGTLTVYEAVLYSALLRLPHQMSREAKERRVRETLIEMGIDKIADRRIGQPGKRGISGGEKRRVSIAMEVVVGPSILFLDEPTSGLDSANAMSVVQSLISLAKNNNRTVVMTIHQPRSNIFTLFDRLLLLAEGGFMVYSGPLHSLTPASSQNDNQPPCHLLDSFLNDIGLPCPHGFNIADYLLDLTMFKHSASLSVPSKSDDSVASSPVKVDSPSAQQQQQQQQQQEEKNEEEIVDDVGSGSSGRSNNLHLRQLSSRNGNRNNQGNQSSQGPMHLNMYGFDLAELQLRQPKLIPVVTGYLRSEVCRDLRDSIAGECGSVTPIVADSDLQHLQPGPLEPGQMQSPTLKDQLQQLHQQQQQQDNAADELSPLLEGVPGSSRPVGAPPSYSEITVDDYTPDLHRSPRSLKGPQWWRRNVVWHTLFPTNAPGGSATGSQTAAGADQSGAGVSGKRMGALWNRQFQVLCWRTIVNIFRNPLLLISHYLIAVCIGLLCAVVFHNLSFTLSGFQGRFGLFFFISITNALINLTTVDIFSRERLLFMRERANGYYSVSAYFLSKVFCDIIPLRVIPPLLTGLILYHPAGLVADSLHCAKFLLAFVMTNLASASLVLIFAAAFSSASVANFVSVILLVVAFLFSGLFVNKAELPIYTAWLRFYSPFNYGYEAMCVNEMLSLTLKDTQYGKDIELPGGVLLKSLGMQATKYWKNIIELGFLSVIYIMAAFLVVQIFVRETR